MYNILHSAEKLIKFYLHSLACKEPDKCISLSVVPDSVTPRTVAHQGPLSMGFSTLEYWSGLSFPSPADLPDPGIEPGSPALQADSLPIEPPGKPSHLHYPGPK